MNVEQLVYETIRLLRGIPTSKERGEGLDALGVIVISHTNMDNEPTKLITAVPAPQAGDSLQYESFLDDICIAFRNRFDV